MLVISCVQERDKGCLLSVVSKRVIKDAGYQLWPGGVKDLIICYVQESDKGCWLSVVSKRGIKDAGYHLCPG